MSKLIVKRGEFKGTKMIYIFKTESDADLAAEGVKIFPAFSCGIKKAEVIIHHIKEMAEFVSEEGQISADYNDTVLAEFVEFMESE